MLQSIQYVGSGPPTYVYSDNATSASNMFFRVFASETSGYKSQRQKRQEIERRSKEKADVETVVEENRVVETTRKENLQEAYQKQYGRRESFLWKQR